LPRRRVKAHRAGKSQGEPSRQLQRGCHAACLEGVRWLLSAGFAFLGPCVGRQCAAGRPTVVADGAEEQELLEVPARPYRPADAASSPSCCCSPFFAALGPLPSLHEVHIPRLSVCSVAEELLAEEWPEDSLMGGLFAALGASEIQISSWKDGSTCAGSPQSDTVVRIRTVTMRVPIPPVPMYPRTTRQTVTYCITARPSDSMAPIILESTGMSHDVPYGERFTVQERFELRPSLDGCSIRVTQAGRVLFQESCGLMQSSINAATLSGLKRTGQQVMSALQQRATGLVASPPECESASAGPQHGAAAGTAAASQGSPKAGLAETCRQRARLQKLSAFRLSSRRATSARPAATSSEDPPRAARGFLWQLREKSCKGGIGQRWLRLSSCSWGPLPI